MNAFENLGLSKEVLRALNEMKFHDPTPIQELAIPFLFQGEDIVGQAQTGTGKTAAFGIYMVENVDPFRKYPQALVLAPTRELAVQICKEVSSIGKYKNVRMLPVYGGASIERQIDELRRGVHIVVGTPGRVIDHLKRGTLDLSKVKIVVLDESDRMLDMGFIEDVEFILKHAQKQRQTMLFSATMPSEVLKLSKNYMVHPQFIKVSEDTVPVDKIKQHFARLDPRDKFKAVVAYLQTKKPEHTIIFCKTKYGADNLAQGLRRMGFNAAEMHGNLSQKQRDDVMHQFREKRLNILVASDLASRGIDVLHVTHVINYNMPEDADVYVHRIGRTGRIGNEGTALSLVANDELGLIGEIERKLGVRMNEEKIDFSHVKTGVAPSAHGQTYVERHSGGRQSRGGRQGSPRRREGGRTDRRGDGNERKRKPPWEKPANRGPPVLHYG